MLTQTQAAAPYRYLSAGQGRFSLEVSRSPGRLRAERGDLTMTFEEVAILLTLLGGSDLCDVPDYMDCVSRR